MKLTKWLNKMVITLILTMSGLGKLHAQKITLPEVQERARLNYPVLKQKNLLQESESVTISNLNKGYLPQVSVNGQATYQSEVTKVAVSLPGINIPSPGKDQYKATADINQVLYDGGLISQQKKIQQLNTETEDQRIEVELYKLKERINQLYLSIIYLDQQQAQINLVKNDLQIGISKLKAQVENGVAFRSNLDVLNAELLKTEQRKIELISSREGLINTLSILTGQNLAPDTQLTIPPSPSLQTEITRPELDLFDKQTALVNQHKRLTLAKNLPKVSLFGQGGYGRPGLNMLKNEFDWFYIAGARINWNFSSLYTTKGENKLIDINKRNIQTQRDVFILNTQSQLAQQSAEIRKLERLIAADTEIISLREKVKTAARSQLQNGVTSASDYLREVNAADLARQTQITHQLQLLQAQIAYQNISGK